MKTFKITKTEIATFATCLVTTIVTKNPIPLVGYIACKTGYELGKNSDNKKPQSYWGESEA